MKLPVHTMDGGQSGESVELNESVFAIDPNDHAIYQAVIAEQTRQRHGTSSTKTRAEVAGARKKLFRQKGTGNARAGSIRTPVRVGGGRAFGPKPRDYQYSLPKKMKSLARRSALSYRAREDALLLVEDFTLEKPETRRMAALFRALGVTGRRVLFVTGEPSELVLKSCRNIPNVVVRHGNCFSTLDVLGCERIVFQKSALAHVGATKSDEGSGESDTAAAGH